MNVAVLGAGGTIAPAIVRDLASSDEVESMALLDLDLERAEAVAAAHGGGKARSSRVDARAPAEEPESLARALEGCDALVNSASYRINLEAMRACLATGCHYLDLGGLYWMTAKQLDLSKDFERLGLLALLGIGSAPGKTNLMGETAVRALRAPGADLEPAAVESVHVYAAGRDLDPPPGFSVPYALQTLIDELSLRPVVLREGRAEEIEPLADGGGFDFGEPIGEGQTIYTLHSELNTFGESFGCREAGFRLCLSPALLAELRDLVGAPEAEVAKRAAEALPPSARTVSVHVVEATAGGFRSRVRAVTEPHEEWGLGGGIVSTAAPIAAAVRLLARGAVEARGALPPERCVDPPEMFAELERRGCRFEVTTGEEIRA